jgi:hypothetical protein
VSSRISQYPIRPPSSGPTIVAQPIDDQWYLDSPTTARQESTRTHVSHTPRPDSPTNFLCKPYPHDLTKIHERRLTKQSPDKRQKHTTGGIPRWSPTLVLVARFSAYVWQSGRDAQFSLTYGRMYLYEFVTIYKNPLSKVSSGLERKAAAEGHPQQPRL